MTGLRLLAPSPARWLATHLETVTWGGDVEVAHHGCDALPAGAVEEAMSVAHRRYVAEGATPQAAAKWVVSDHAGAFAAAAGFFYAYAGAASLDVQGVRFGARPGGSVPLGDRAAPRVAVGAGHPWSDLPGVQTVADETAVADLAVASVARLAAPIVAVGRSLARVGAVSLWAEVADAVASCLVSNDDHPVDPALVESLRLLVGRPGAPWRSRPDLWLVEHGRTRVALIRKGGCCLAYQCDDPEPADARYRAAFPAAPGEPDYCTTCSLRTRADCQARQLWDHDQARVHPNPR